MKNRELGELGPPSAWVPPPFRVPQVLFVATEAAKSFRQSGERVRGLCSAIVLSLKFLCEAFAGGPPSSVGAQPLGSDFGCG